MGSRVDSVRYTVRSMKLGSNSLEEFEMEYVRGTSGVMSFGSHAKLVRSNAPSHICSATSAIAV